MQVNPVRRHAREVSCRVVHDVPQLQAVSPIHRRCHIRQGIGIVVAGLRIVTARFLDVVADAVAVHVRRTVSATDTDGIKLVAIAIAVAGRNVGTAAIIDGAGTVANTTGIRHTDTVIVVIADAIAVRICRAVTTADTDGIELLAGAVIVRCGRIVVAGRLIRTSGDLVLVADAVAIAVVQAVAIAVLTCRWVDACRVATTTAAVGVDRQAHGDVVVIVTGREDLDIDRTADVTVRGQLGQQDRTVRSGQSVDIPVQDVPHAADLIVHDDVSARNAATGFEDQRPVLLGRVHHGSCAFASVGISGPIDADGHPAVVVQVRESRQQQGIHILRGNAAKDVL